MSTLPPITLDSSQYVIFGRGEIQKAPTRTIRLVPVPQWDDSETGTKAAVYMRSLNGAERNRHNATMVDINLLNRTGKQRFSVESPQAKLLAFCICDAGGAPIYNEREIEELNRLDSAVLEYLYEIAQAMNGLGKKAEDEAGNDSEATPSDAPGSPSPSPSTPPTALLGYRSESVAPSSPNGSPSEGSNPTALNGTIGAPV